MNKRVKLVISGRVQGVFFRASARAIATTLGLTGYARNFPNRDVEIVAEGEDASIVKLAEWAGQGPTGAVVDSVSAEYSETTDLFDDFVIRY